MRTQHFLRSVAVLVAALSLCVVTIAFAADDAKWNPANVPTPPLRPIATVTPKRVALANGIVIYLLEDHTLPIVRGIAYAKGTPLWVERGKVGLGPITGEVMRSGGTAKHPGDALDDRLASIGAAVETSYDGREMANASFHCLADNTNEVVGLWAEIMREPAFPDTKIELSRVGLRRQIASRNDDMSDVLFRVMRQAVYGKDNIWYWSREPEYATIEAVTRQDCIGLHRKLFEPSRMVLALYGDFRAADMTKLLTSKLGDWKGAHEPFPPIPPVPTDSKPRLVFADKEDVTQSGVLLGHAGFRADDPDYPAMSVFETALGGGFQSRLVNRIRTERGLAYATGAVAGDGYVRPGIFIAYSLTKSESTMTALGLLRDEVKRSVTEPFTNDEVRIARNTVENTFVFNFAQPSDILFRAAYYEAIGYPQDFLQKYQKALQSVDGAAVTAAARRKVHPEQLVAVVVGREHDFERPLASAGLPVERADISIPPPPSRTKQGSVVPAPGAEQQGREWLRQAADVAGGPLAWQQVKTQRLETSSTVVMGGRNIAASSKLAWKLPDRIVSVRTLPFGETKIGFDGKNGWSTMGATIKDEPELAKSVREEYERSLFYLFGHADQIQVAAAEPQTIDGVDYRVARVRGGAVPEFSLYFAPDGRLARIEYQGDGPQGPALNTEILSDWRRAGKVQYPYGRRVLIDGEPYLEAKVTQVTFDAPIEDSSFSKPSR